MKQILNTLINSDLSVNVQIIYQDTRYMRPKKSAHHTVGILTGRKKMSFSHFCIPDPLSDWNQIYYRVAHQPRESTHQS